MKFLKYLAFAALPLATGCVVSVGDGDFDGGSLFDDDDFFNDDDKPKDDAGTSAPADDDTTTKDSGGDMPADDDTTAKDSGGDMPADDDTTVKDSGGDMPDAMMSGGLTDEEKVMWCSAQLESELTDACDSCMYERCCDARAECDDNDECFGAWNDFRTCMDMRSSPGMESVDPEADLAACLEETAPADNFLLDAAVYCSLTPYDPEMDGFEDPSLQPGDGWCSQTCFSILSVEF